MNSTNHDPSHFSEWPHNVGPFDHINPTPATTYNLVVLGGGTAGLVAAMGAAGLGARVALIEKKYLGGDCLNTGCVPSKALLSSAHVIGQLDRLFSKGILEGQCRIDASKAFDHMKSLRNQISHHDSVQRLQSAGVDVFFGHARFQNRRSLSVGDQALHFSKAIIATGTKPSPIVVDGMTSQDYHTNETIFSLKKIPESLMIVGSGAMACEMAQIFSQLGTKVKMLTRSPRVLSKEDPDLSMELQRMFQSQGIEVKCGVSLHRFYQKNEAKVLIYQQGQQTYDCSAQDILVAAGRIPNLEDLQLEKANIHSNPQGLLINSYLQTTNSHVYASGDVVGKQQYTHAADAMSRMILENAFFSIPFLKPQKKWDSQLVPHCTYTQPELAHVGESMDRANLSSRFVHEMSCQHTDRFVLEDQPEGRIKVLVDSRGRIKGVSLLSSHAGELISLGTLAIQKNMKLLEFSSLIFSYPTRSEIWKKISDQHRRKNLTPFLLRCLSRYFSWR
ncbi:MAG: FAD-dependent oxidoreductase [Bdellovibrionota bacterium]